MKSIRTKISGLVLLCVAVAAILVGVIGISSSRSVIQDNSQQILELLCTNRAEELNALLSRIEQSVTTLADYAVLHMDDLARFKADGGYVSDYSAYMENVALNAARNTEGAMTVYIRYNPEFTDPNSGVFYSRPSGNSDFEAVTPTDFSMYDPSDTAHVGWYYIPIQNGVPTWMDPYLNENINVEMISFVIPIEVEGEFIGIVGMDIDFGVIEDVVEEIKVYDTGYAYLEYGDAAEGVTMPAGNETVWEELKNGMRMAVTAPSAEIYQESTRLMLKIVVVVAAVILISLLISAIVVRNIVRPLQELNTAAGHIAAGELDVSITSRSRDEVGTLADSFRQTVDRLRTYMAYIDELSAVLGGIGDGNLAVELKQQYNGEFVRLKDAILRIERTLSEDLYQIRAAAGQVASGSEQVASGAVDLNEGSMKQGTSVEKLTDRTQEMLADVRENRERAQLANTVVVASGAGLEESGRQMENMLAAMGRISESAAAIAKIIQTIRGIAEQTNILALNAAIEAARAGEAGKGFAVVAGEVKELAAKSAEASSSVDGLVQNTLRSIEDGEHIAEITRHSIQETVEGAHKVEAMVEEIVASTQRQEADVAEVQENVREISNVTSQNTATAQQEAAISEELSTQADLLRDLVGKFTLLDAGLTGKGR